MKQPWIPALIFSLIILGCFLLGALIDKYFRMKAMREFARRYRAAEMEGTYWIGKDGRVLYSPTDSIDSPQP